MGLEDLREQWKKIFQNRLPNAATSKDSAQSVWPVHVDHCFARIILDKVVGIDTPWMEKIGKPAYMNMSREQLLASIELGSQILKGKVDLVDLDNQSLELRGKEKKGSQQKSTRKRKSAALTENKFGISNNIKAESPTIKKQRIQSPSQQIETSSIQRPEFSNVPSSAANEDIDALLQRISKSSKTTFQKRVLSALCQVPRGHYTTYGTISKHLSSSPRAVGNALKNNPFAPAVPCHRVLAADGSIGGFGGSWGRKGEEGTNDQEKRRLLREEGVRFDGRGRVVGSAFEGFR